MIFRTTGAATAAPGEEIETGRRTVAEVQASLFCGYGRDLAAGVAADAFRLEHAGDCGGNVLASPLRMRYSSVSRSISPTSAGFLHERLPRHADLGELFFAGFSQTDEQAGHGIRRPASPGRRLTIAVIPPTLHLYFSVNLVRQGMASFHG